MMSIRAKNSTKSC